jgi:protein-S-isoprenylcysteine O-methyltransferase Ste14
MLEIFLKILYLIGLLLAEAIRLPHRRKLKQDRQQKKNADKRLTKAERTVPFLILLGMWVIPLVYVFTPWLAFANYRLPGWAGWFGAVIFAAGLWLRRQAHADLGRNWSSTLIVWEEQSLVTEGIFRHIRHPIYAALWLWSLAQPLLLQNWAAGLGGLVALIPLYLLRVPREEQMLLEHFGQAYRLYMSRTGRVVPRWWR